MKTCPTCGTPCEVVSSGEGTNHYRPVYEDDTPIDEGCLREMGFSAGTLSWSILLPPVCAGAAIAEFLVTPDPHGGFDVSIAQGVPDDQHRPDDIVALTSLPPDITRGQLRRLLAALKGGE